MDLVSIVTPAFNSARFIADTIRSVQNQTYEGWEMIVVDDCSRDDTIGIVERAAACDPRVRLLRQASNAGPAAARDVALVAARGRYIAFLDSDDLWLPQKLVHQIEFMHANKAGFSFTQFRRISETREAAGRLIAIPSRLDYYGLLKNTAIATSTVIVDREMTGPLRMTRTYYDDFVLWLELAKRGFAAYGLREDLMRYRVVGQSVSRNKINSAKWVWRTYREIEQLGRIRACWYLGNYAINAVLKYSRF